MADLRVQAAPGSRGAIVAILTASSLACASSRIARAKAAPAQGAPAKAAPPKAATAPLGGDRLAVAPRAAQLAPKPQDPRVPGFESAISDAIGDLSATSKDFKPVSIELAPAPSGELWFFTAKVEETSSAYETPRSVVSTAKGAIGVNDGKVYFTQFPKIA